MIPQLVITSWSDEGNKLYGERWRDGWCEHWLTPHHIPALMYTDDMIAEDPEVRAFREREADAQTTSGDYRRGALKWSWKVFALTMEPMPTSGWMIWIDGDVEFTKTPTQEWFDAVCPDDADVSYLARPWAYASETGFVAYNMGSERARDLLGDMRRMYLYGTFRALENWGDASVFDSCRAMQHEDLRENNLAAHCTGPDLHVWPHTVLGECLVHRKGPKRKQEAYGGAV